MALPVVWIERHETGDQGTFGRIIAPRGLILFTGEQPWRDNATGLSCIPLGTYRSVWTWSRAFKRMMYLLLDTDPRVGIRAHSANLMGDLAKGHRSQLQGCIALGERLGWIEGQKALLLSAPAVRRFETTMDRQPFMLEIVNA
jgi:hypothetical protein